MRQGPRLRICLIVVGLLFTVASNGLADVSPGDVIGQENWEKAEGLLPEPVLDWVKAGDIFLNVAELKYDPADYRNDECKATLESNKGKYDLDKDDMIIEKATGKFPDFIDGVPFPESEIDASDPKAGTKIVYNKFYYTYVQGNQKLPFGTIWVSRKNGLEREVSCEWQQYPMDGLLARKGAPNRDGYERFSLIRVLAPFDIAGTNILLMRYRGKNMDSTLAYVPAIRRVRRMSPANRSDSFIGSDCCVDDAWLFDGKAIAFEWKVIRKQQALLPFLDTDVQPLERGPAGSLVTGKGIKQIRYGYDDPSWKGAPWLPTNLVWVKRPAYLLEVTPKDPYYNYGKQYIWVDAQVNMMMVWKVINDRAGNYWKTVWYSYAGFATPDGKDRMVGGTSMLCQDDRTEHGTIIRFPEPENQWVYKATLNKNDYSLGGFQKLCK